MKTIVYVGTRKGCFVFESEDRKEWRKTAMHFPGWVVQHMIRDSRDGRLYAALDSMIYGTNIHWSDDDGETWHIAESEYRVNTETTVTRLWTVHAGHQDRPGVVWAGADPGALLKSEDYGKNWAPVLGFNEHPTREKWHPGAGGMMVHSFAQDPRDPDHITIGMSAGGVFQTYDGGKSWEPSNTGILADFQPEKYPEVGQCVHHMEISPADPNVLYQQNHCGVYRSEDSGKSWINCTEGLPSYFGFPMAVHHHKVGTIFTVPQTNEEFRYVPEGKFRVFRSRNGGDEWEPLTNGLPQENAFLSVYRLAMACDAHEQAGVYVGTTGGTAYFSNNEGDSWSVLSDTLPPIYSVTTATIKD